MTQNTQKKNVWDFIVYEICKLINCYKHKTLVALFSSLSPYCFLPQPFSSGALVLLSIFAGLLLFTFLYFQEVLKGHWKYQPGAVLSATAVLLM